MSEQRADHLERLISRYLDEESTSAERRELKGVLRRDPAAEALFEEHRSLDREVRVALRRSLGRPLGVRTISLRRQIGRATAIGVAACLALALWIDPPGRYAPTRRSSEQAGMVAPRASWFDNLPMPRDSFREDAPRDGRPKVRLYDTQRRWIVVPGKKPGEYLLIEVRRIHERSIRVQQDF